MVSEEAVFGCVNDAVCGCALQRYGLLCSWSCVFLTCAMQGRAFSCGGRRAIHMDAVAPGAPTGPMRRPVVILVIGMAGTGKTTLVHRLQHHATARGLRSYFINLDPAVSDVPYDANIDIRDTVSYGEVMRQYRLGPNGAIMTALNLFTTKFHQVVSLVEAKEDLDWIVVDTPGQIEVFTWSASGQLIAETLAATLPTVLLFVADTARCARPQTFISTMLYSSGIMLKLQLPLVVAWNKTDVVPADTAVSWMRDETLLEDAVVADSASGVGEEPYEGVWCGDSYAGTLARSLSLFLHGFYEDLPSAAVSAATGAGMEQLEAAVGRAKMQFCEERHRDRLAVLNEREQTGRDRQERRRTVLIRNLRDEPTA